MSIIAFHSIGRLAWTGCACCVLVTELQQKQQQQQRQRGAEIRASWWRHSWQRTSCKQSSQDAGFCDVNASFRPHQATKLVLSYVLSAVGLTLHLLCMFFDSIQQAYIADRLIFSFSLSLSIWTASDSIWSRRVLGGVHLPPTEVFRWRLSE